MPVRRTPALVLLVAWSLVACTPERRADDSTDDPAPAASDGGTCEPRCSGRECGPDGCGGICGTCAGGLPCSASGTCEHPKTCGNAQRDPGETDVDCGGLCLPCAVGQLCAEHRDCLSASCQFGRCEKPNCADHLQNQGEGDVDCGAVCFVGCGDGKTCGADADCASRQCAAGRCVSCTDRVENGNESDVDCGGTCTKCEAGRACRVGGDCASGRCAGGLCVTCSDGLRNGGESDVDCGSACELGCADGRLCARHADCASSNCSGGRCVSCADRLKNGGESDVDCGAACGTGCADGKGCFSGDDCASRTCESGRCVPAPTCTDGRKNGTESDVDCGGSCGATCGTGKGCATDRDCASGVCDAGRCWAWTVEAISGPEQAGGAHATSFDPSGVLHAAYNELASGGNLLRHASRAGGSWATDVSDLNNGDDLSIDDVALAFDAAGVAHAAMLRRGPRAPSGSGAISLDVARRSGSGWTVSTLAPSLSSAGCSSSGTLDFARDPSGVLRLAWISNGTLSWASPSASGWTTQTFAGFPACTMALALAFTAQGTPLLATVSWENATYAIRVHRLENGQWSSESTGKTGRYAVVDLVAGGAGEPLLAYVDDGTTLLSLLQKTGGSWSSQAIDGQTSAMFFSLARDTAGALHVAYSDKNTLRLRYTKQSGTSWKITPVAGAVTYVPALVLDAANKPWLVYRDFTSNKLTVAH